MKQVRWAIMGAGGIARRFAASLAHMEQAELVAIAGRSHAKLDAFVQALSADHIVRYADDDGSALSAYERLVEADDIDAVYLSLPHGLHTEWACRLLQAGKAVLCEKPAAVSAEEMHRIEQAARETGSLFMEAMKPRFSPVRERILSLVEQGELGAVRSLSLTHHIDYGEYAGPYLFDPAQGGCLLDLGCYDISWVCDLLDGDAAVKSAEVAWRTDGVKPTVDGPGRVDWGDEVRMTVGRTPVSLSLMGDAREVEVRMTVTFERGEVQVERFHRPEAFTLRRDGEPSEVVSLPFAVDDFYGEASHFNELVLEGARESPIMPLSESVRFAEMTDAIRAAWPAA